MRAVRRDDIAPPNVLTASDARGAKELERVRAHMDDPVTRKKTFGFSVYKDDEVKAALQALFHGKCAYCESYYDAVAPVDVEHFRPKGSVEGAPTHPGYWWIAGDWRNLLPSCIDCNRRRRQETPDPSTSLVALRAYATRTRSTGKQASFPVAGARAFGELDDLLAEEALLLNPTEDDPDAHLEFHIDPLFPLGLVLPRGGGLPGAGANADVAAAALGAGASARGAVSIQVYGLNRLGLVQERTRILRRLEFHRQMIAEIDDIAARLADEAGGPASLAAVRRLDNLIDRVVEDVRAMAAPDQPYSGLARQWIRRFLDELT
ncbi:MAG: hypothetical protein WD969_00215 [Paracoccaceae bacterium]